MPTAKSKSLSSPGQGTDRLSARVSGTEYRGKQMRTGNSLGFRFDRALFRSHPEFVGEVKAQVIAPGRMLVSVAEPVAEHHDPVMASFLAFLANHIQSAPENIKPMDRELKQRIDRLVEGMTVDPDEPLGDESLL